MKFKCFSLVGLPDTVRSCRPISSFGLKIAAVKINNYPHFILARILIVHILYIEFVWFYSHFKKVINFKLCLLLLYYCHYLDDFLHRKYSTMYSSDIINLNFCTVCSIIIIKPQMQQLNTSQMLHSQCSLTGRRTVKLTGTG